MKRVLVACGVVLLLFYGAWIIVIPEDFIISRVEDSLKARNLGIEATGFKKGLFFNFTAQRIVLKKMDAILLSTGEVSGRINPLNLLLMRISVSLNGKLSGGIIRGNVSISKRKNEAHFFFNDSRLEEMPLLSAAGLSGRGTLSGEFSLNDNSGTIRFTILDARIDRKAFSGIMLPLDIFHRVQCSMVISGAVLQVESFSLEGNDIYARIKGNISNGNMDLVMEVMPGASFRGDALMLALLEQFKVSPGYYSLPVKGPVLW
jgi:type II secretion system protein N